MRVLESKRGTGVPCPYEIKDAARGRVRVLKSKTGTGVPCPYGFVWVRLAAASTGAGQIVY